MSPPLPDLDLATLLETAPDDRIAAIVGAALRPFPTVALYVLDRDLRMHLAEGPSAHAAGYSTAALRGRRLHDFSPANVAAVLEPHFRAAFAGEERRFRLAYLIEDRTYVCFVSPIRNRSGAILGAANLSIDITHDAAEQQRLGEAEERYRLLADTATEVVSLHDLDGRYRYISPSVAAITGWTAEELLGRAWPELAHPDDLPQVLESMRELIFGGDQTVLTFRQTTASGRYVWFESVVRAIRDPLTGRVNELRVSSRDISDRKEHERRVAETTAELERRLAQTAAVARLGEQALEDPDLDKLLHAACVATAERLEVPLTSVLELRGPGEPLLARAGFGWDRVLPGLPAQPKSIDNLEHALDLLAEGPVVAADERFRTALYDKLGVVSAMHVLIGERQAPWGVLSAASTVQRDFDQADRDFLQSVGHVIGDAVARRRAEEAARHEALHDPLTGLPNRALLVDRLSQALRRRGSLRTAVLVLDVDEFKVVNDSLGHEVGDELLREVGPRLAAAVRPGDTIARFSGDTFAVVCEDIADETHAQRLAERLTSAFASPFVLRGEQLFVSASVGVVVSSGGDRAEDLVRDADVAMHRAKEAGKGGFELFDHELRQRAISRLRIESDLRRALGADELRVHYQPFWSLPDRRLAGLEALVRWQHPERGLVSPGEFVPIAESSGLIVPVGAWVLRESCRQFAGWRRDHPAAADLRLRVNLSARQVSQPGLLDIVAAALADHELEPSAVGLEITEGLLLQDSDAVAGTLHGLKELGVQLVLDDFGTGYASLSYLKRFPIDQLKIDRSFVLELEERDENRALVAAIVGMAAALGLSVVPEGIETEGQLGVLQELGCQFAQGFLLARPLEPADVEALLERLG